MTSHDAMNGGGSKRLTLVVPLLSQPIPFHYFRLSNINQGAGKNQDLVDFVEGCIHDLCASYWNYLML